MLQPFSIYKLERVHDLMARLSYGDVGFMVYAMGKDVAKANAIMNHIKQQETNTSALVKI